jgi:hypothetical protein
MSEQKTPDFTLESGKISTPEHCKTTYYFGVKSDFQVGMPGALAFKLEDLVNTVLPPGVPQ